MTDTALVCDFAIAGGGSAGCLLAARLIESGYRVCLVEAGEKRGGIDSRLPALGTFAMEDRAQTWRYQASPNARIEGRQILIRQGRRLGGTGALNGMCYVRGRADDFDGWNVPGWRWADVLPYFERTEDYRGRHAGQRGSSGPIRISDNDFRIPVSEAFVRSAIASGIAANAAPNTGDNEGTGYYERFIFRGWRTSDTYRNALRRYRSSGRLILLSGHAVERIAFDGRRATGLEITRLADRTRRIVRVTREVILSAGAFGSPAILQRSGIGPEPVLAQAGVTPIVNAPDVGANLQDHFSIRLIVESPGARTINDFARWPRVVLQAARWALGRPSILSVSPALAYAFFRALPDAEKIDATIFFSPGRLGSAGPALSHQGGITCGIYPLRPESRGTVRIISSSASDAPDIQPNYLHAERDLAITIAALKRARRIFSLPPLSGYAGREVAPGPDVATDDEMADFIRSTGVSSHHPCGSVALGRALDSDLSVIGVSGVRVADASVLPVMPSGNILAPVLMVAERAAAFLHHPGGTG